MKMWVFTLGLALLAVQLASAATTSQLRFISGGNECTINDNGGVFTDAGSCVGLSGDLFSNDGQINVHGTLNGWTISVTTGTSNSPVTNAPITGLSVSGTLSTCNGPGLPDNGLCATQALEVLFSDQNFGVPSPTADFRFHDSTTINGAGSATASGYFSQTNNNFAESAAGLIGTVNFTTDDGTNVIKAATATKPYSETIDDVFDVPTTGGVTYTPGTTISADPVPEPASIAFFGGVIALCASRLRRRKVA